MERLIFHVDVNSAFLSWEAARRVAEGKEDLRLIPSIIGGNPEQRTSIVLAKSIPAKKYGIETGEPVSAAFRKCPGLVSVPSDFELYSQNSKAFRAICHDFTPVVEVFSIDECFLDMTGMGKLFPDYMVAARQLKERIKSELGFTVNVGVSSNKLLAKMASDFEKPDKIHTLFPEEVPEKMWPLPVGELFLCGKASVRKLKQVQINTIGDMAACSPETVQVILGKKLGLQLWQFANGISDAEVNGEVQAPKGYSNEITFDDNITDFQQGDKVLLHLADNVAARVRKDDVKGRCISVTIRGNDMKKRSHQQKLERATDSTSHVYDVSRKLFRELWDGATPLRLIGLSLSDMDNDTNETEEQTSMFEQISMFDHVSTTNGVSTYDRASGGEREATSGQESRVGPKPTSGQEFTFDRISAEADSAADRAVDALREKFGNDIIKRGGMIGSDIKVRKKE